MKKYEISTKTLNDIMEKIPSDRWDTVMDELKIGLQHAQMSFDLANSLEEIFDSKEKTECKFPDPIIWVDDGRGEVKVNHSINNEKIFTTKQTLT